MIPLPQKFEIPRKAKKEQEAIGSSSPIAVAPENGVKHALEDPEENGVAKKRKLDGDLAVGESRPSKKQLVDNAEDGPIDVDDDGFIMID